jgi:hypothetical protein
VAFSLAATVARGDPRPFTFTYDTYPETKGAIEYEQWVTWRHHTKEDSGFDAVDFRHEFEFGVADNFDLSIYVPTWHYEDSAVRKGTKFDSVGVEGILYLSNPVTDFIGSGLYGEINVGDEEIEYEFKLLLHKDIGNWTLAYNLILETEVEGVFHDDEENEVEGVLGHALGASYSLSPHWRGGAEMAIESVYDNWSHYEDTTVYAGPTIGYSSGGHWWVTVTPAFQLSDVDDEADYVVRLIAGWEF